jgi:hypothetical protein
MKVILSVSRVKTNLTKEYLKMNRNPEFYLLMLEILLLEIRNLEDSQLSQAKSLAYIFHNVPGILRCNFNEKTAGEAFEVIRSRAEYFGLSNQIDKWEERAFERIRFEQMKKGLVQTPPSDIE